ncbi:MAG TPA: YciI-like protein [Holophagaceae bacterium]
MHYLLMYELGPGYMERRAQFREEHLALAREAHARGELMLAGTLAEPVDSALFLFQGDSPAPASRFAAADPYVLHGLIRHWQVRPWVALVGADASASTSPAR